MDAKITKNRLGLLLSYDWIKIVCICLAVVLLWMLIFTMTATRATDGQIFDLYSYIGVRFNTDNMASLEQLRERDAFSDDVLAFNVSAVNQDGYENMILQTWMMAGQGDALFTADTGPERDENGNITAYTGLSEFLMAATYRVNSRWLGEDDYSDGTFTYGPSYFTQCAEYLNRFYPGGYEGGTLDNMNKAAVEENFRSRIEGDKRYKNEMQIAEGLEKEYARIQNLRDAFAAVYEWTHNESADDPIELRTIEVEGDTDGDNQPDKTFRWTYAFDLSNLENITELVSNDGSAEGVCMVVLSSGCIDEVDLSFEQFTLLKYLADRYDTSAG